MKSVLEKQLGYSNKEIEELTQTPKVTLKIFYFSFFLFFFVIVALAVLPWWQTSRGTGRVIAFKPEERRQDLTATVNGRIKEWFIVEGQKVEKDDPIVQLEDNDPAILERLDKEREALEQRLKAAEVAQETVKVNLDRQKKLFQQGLVSRREYEKANLEYADYVVAVSEGAAELARIDVRIARQLSQLVKAPRAGSILSVLQGQGGQIVKAGDPLVVFVPESSNRVVELWIDGNDLPLIRPGRKVRLQFEGWPAIQFSGWPSVAVGTFGGVVQFVDATDDGRGQFRTIIKQDPEDPIPWPSGEFLRQGVRAIGWILLDRVTLGFEIWRRLNGFPISSLPYSVEEKKVKNLDNKAKDDGLGKKLKPLFKSK